MSVSCSVLHDCDIPVSLEPWLLQQQVLCPPNHHGQTTNAGEAEAAEGLFSVRKNMPSLWHLSIVSTSIGETRCQVRLRLCHCLANIDDKRAEHTKCVVKYCKSLKEGTQNQVGMGRNLSKQHVCGLSPSSRRRIVPDGLSDSPSSA